MKCPIDDAPLVMTERSGIEIDYCPTCRGVWLDRGELDKIIERSAPGGAAHLPPAVPDPAAPPPGAPRYDDPYGQGYGGGYDPRYDQRYDQRGQDPRYDPRRQDPRYRKKKRGGFLEDLFDFD